MVVAVKTHLKWVRIQRQLWSVRFLSVCKGCAAPSLILTLQLDFVEVLEFCCKAEMESTTTSAVETLTRRRAIVFLGLVYEQTN